MVAFTVYSVCCTAYAEVAEGDGEKATDEAESEEEGDGKESAKSKVEDEALEESTLE